MTTDRDAAAAEGCREGAARGGGGGRPAARGRGRPLANGLGLGGGPSRGAGAGRAGRAAGSPGTSAAASPRAPRPRAAPSPAPVPAARGGVPARSGRSSQRTARSRWVGEGRRRGSGGGGLCSVPPGRVRGLELHWVPTSRGGCRRALGSPRSGLHGAGGGAWGRGAELRSDLIGGVTGSNPGQRGGERGRGGRWGLGAVAAAGRGASLGAGEELSPGPRRG